MKKLTALILSAAFLFCLFGCGADTKNTEQGNTKISDEQIPIEIENTKIVDDYAEITLRKVFTASKVGSLFSNNCSLELLSGEKRCIDCIFDVKNLSGSSIMSDELLSVTAKSFYGTEYNADIFAVEENGFLNSYSELRPNSKYTMHVAVSIPDSEIEFTLLINVNGQIFTIAYNVNDILRKAIPLTEGQTIGDEEYAKLKLNGVEFTNSVVPTHPGDYFTYYEVENTSNTYMVVKMSITNYQSSGKEADELVYAKARFSEKYEYNGFIVKENSAGDDLEQYGQIDPLEEANMYLIIEVPKSVVESTYEISLMFNNQEYLINK